MPAFEPPSKDIVVTVSVSGIWNWFKNRKKKQDIDNILRYEETVKNRMDEVQKEE